jgi:hypothetical protein
MIDLNEFKKLVEPKNEPKNDLKNEMLQLKKQELELKRERLNLERFKLKTQKSEPPSNDNLKYYAFIAYLVILINAILVVVILIKG